MEQQKSSLKEWILYLVIIFILVILFSIVLFAFYKIHYLVDTNHINYAELALRHTKLVHELKDIKQEIKDIIVFNNHKTKSFDYALIGVMCATAILHRIVFKSSGSSSTSFPRDYID